jgi:hypothetical protein
METFQKMQENQFQFFLFISQYHYATSYSYDANLRVAKNNTSVSINTRTEQWHIRFYQGLVCELELKPTVPKAANGCNDTTSHPIKYRGEVNGCFVELKRQF